MILIYNCEKKFNNPVIYNVVLPFLIIILGFIIWVLIKFTDEK